MKYKSNLSRQANNLKIPMLERKQENVTHCAIAIFINLFSEKKSYIQKGFIFYHLIYWIKRNERKELISQI
jgi:hypothetical protein